MLSFNNTEVAFANRSNKELKKAHFVFSVLAISWLNAIGTRLTMFALNLRLPVKGLIKYAVFNHFCGGENINGCKKRIEELYNYKVGTILDYSVEGDQNEEAFEECLAQLLEGLRLAQKEKAIPFCVVKLTGLIPFGILEKLDKKSPLSDQEQKAFEKGQARVFQIAAAAVKANTPFMIDAEESWIQNTIDSITHEMMVMHNREKVFIYNTAQMYRHDRLSYIKALHERSKKEGFLIGLKVVRGAYMEKERERAKEKGYPSPIQPDKKSSDRDYNSAIEYIAKNINSIALCCGTHNEESSFMLTQLMEKSGLAKNHKHIHFAQLLGMSDHISYNLSQSGYNVAKYVPYGPVKDVMPYLIRRANENTSVAGQTGRELGLIKKELERRKSLN
jgi:proline dehydrogenase